MPRPIHNLLAAEGFGLLLIASPHPMADLLNKQKFANKNIK